MSKIYKEMIALQNLTNDLMKSFVKVINKKNDISFSGMDIECIEDDKVLHDIELSANRKMDTIAYFINLYKEL